MKPIAVIVMGPSGIGKTTVAELLSERLAWPFAEGDRFHSQANVDRMTRGFALGDAERAPWLARIRDWISEQAEDGHCVVVASSALKRGYRDILRGAQADVRFLQLVAEENVVARRIAQRSGHYMPGSLLSSQFAALESLQPDEAGVRIPADRPPESVAMEAVTLLDLHPAENQVDD